MPNGLGTPNEIDAYVAYANEFVVVEVEYFGTTLKIPDTINYIAADADGEIYGYTTIRPPIYHSTDGRWIRDGYGEHEYLGKLVLRSGDWRDTLQEV